MSDVTPREIIGAVARAYGMDYELVCANGPAPLTRTEQRARLQARLVAVYLLDKHTSARRLEIMDALSLARGRDSRDLIELALCTVEPFIGYDALLAKRVEKAEQRIDELHERRVSRREIEASYALT